MHFSFPHLLDAIHKVIPESKTSKELETQIKDAMTRSMSCSMSVPRGAKFGSGNIFNQLRHSGSRSKIREASRLAPRARFEPVTQG
jgi:hypothetical protein